METPPQRPEPRALGTRSKIGGIRPVHPYRQVVYGANPQNTATETDELVSEDLARRIQLSNPNLAHMVPQHKLEFWPGYVTAVHEYEGGVMLCLDVSHKGLRTSTAGELLRDIYKRDKENLQVNTEKVRLGAIVLTRYNNKTYKIKKTILA